MYIIDKDAVNDPPVAMFYYAVPWEEADTPVYNLIDEDTLLFYLMSDEPIISAVRSNRLKGEITYKKQVKVEGQDNISPLKKPEIDCVTVTDTSHNILDFIHSADQNQLFPEALEFKRIKYPHELIDVTKLFSILDNLDYRLTSIEETIKQIR